MKRRLRKEVKLGLCAFAFLLCSTTILTLSQSLNYETQEDDNTYVTSTIFDEVIPVVSEEVIVLKPYVDAGISILVNYYDHQAEAETQANSLIKYEDTFMQNSGVTYGGKEFFDVVTILDGVVTKVEQNDLLGNIVEITHDNNIISIYQSLGEVNVKQDDVIKQGDIIGKSGTSNINASLGHNITFELIIDGNLVNPENYYNKTLSELKEQ